MRNLLITAQSIFGNLAISNVNSTLASGCSFRLKPSSTASSACFAQARSDSSGIAHCEMTVNPSTPGVIYYEIESWGAGAKAAGLVGRLRFEVKATMTIS